MPRDLVKIDARAFDREIRKQGLKIWWMAEQIGVDRKTVSRWVNGKVNWARIENLLAVSALLGCSPEALMALAENSLAV